MRFLADFKKRDTERKGDKKEEIKSKKLMEENLDDLRGRGRRKIIPAKKGSIRGPGGLAILLSRIVLD